jgi:hypothetical protein
LESKQEPTGAVPSLFFLEFSFTIPNESKQETTGTVPSRFSPEFEKEKRFAFLIFSGECWIFSILSIFSVPEGARIFNSCDKRQPKAYEPNLQGFA